MEDVLKLAGVIALGVFGGLLAKEATDRCRLHLAEKLQKMNEEEPPAKKA